MLVRCAVGLRCCSQHRCAVISLSKDCRVPVVFQSLSHVRLFVTPGVQHTRPPCPSLSPGVCPNFLSMELVMPFNSSILRDDFVRNGSSM